MPAVQRFSLSATRRTAVLAAVLAALATASESSAQVRQRYTPSRPTVSPYLNLLRTNASPVPNYYAIVRPQLQQNDFQRQQTELQFQQNQRLLRQDEEITQLRTNLLRTQQGAEVATGNSSWFQTNGSRQQFMNTSTYYSRVGTGRAR